MNTSEQDLRFRWYNTWWAWTLAFVAVYHCAFIFGIVKIAKYSWPIDFLFAIAGMIAIIYVWRWFNREKLAIKREEWQCTEVIRERFRRVEVAKKAFYHLTGDRFDLWSTNIYDFVSLQVYGPTLEPLSRKVIGFEKIDLATIPKVGEKRESAILPDVWLIVFKYVYVEDEWWKPEAEKSNTQTVRTVMGLGWRHKDYWTIRDSDVGLALCDGNMLMIPISEEVDKTLLFAFIMKYRSVKDAGFDSIVQYGLPEMDPALAQSDPKGRHKWLYLLQPAVQRVAGDFASGLVGDRDELFRRAHNMPPY